MRALLNDLIDKLQETFPPNRIVVLLTPLVFAPTAGYITAYVAEHFPGLPSFDSAQVAAFFIAGATVALVKAYKFIDGWQKAEDRGEV